jgi:hypothetical protein
VSKLLGTFQDVLVACALALRFPKAKGTQERALAPGRFVSAPWRKNCRRLRVRVLSMFSGKLGAVQVETLRSR